MRLPIPPLSRLSGRQYAHCSLGSASIIDFVTAFCIQQLSKIDMTQKSSSKAKAVTDTKELKGWKQIASFLGEPVSVVQRWATEGMPLRRQGRFVATTTKELNDWIGRESGKPVHVATGNADLTSELKRAVSFARREK